MSPQMQEFCLYIASAKAGGKESMKVVRAVLKRAMEVAPERDLLMIADAFVGLSDQFSEALSLERN